MNCGRRAAFSGAPASSKSDRFPGMNCGRRAALGLRLRLGLGCWGLVGLADSPDGPSSFGLDLGGGKKERAVKGRKAALTSLARREA